MKKREYSKKQNFTLCKCYFLEMCKVERLIDKVQGWGFGRVGKGRLGRLGKIEKLTSGWGDVYLAQGSSSFKLT